MGSPHRRVLSASLTARGFSGLPRCSACPTLQASLAPTGSPLFAYHPLHACRGYAPRKHRSSLAMAAAVILPSPQGTAGRLLHDRSISGLFIPFTDVPAYMLPVYASPCALPHPTQDSVPDCWLRFVRAAIADGWTICACKAQPPKNDTCEFPRMPLKPFKRSVWNAVVPRRTIGYGPACDSWDAGGPGCLPYRCHRRSSRWYDGYAIPEDVSNLWICYPLGVRESHQRG
jgi:hypothetical protein